MEENTLLKKKELPKDPKKENLSPENTKNMGGKKTPKDFSQGPQTNYKEKTFEGNKK